MRPAAAPRAAGSAWLRMDVAAAVPAALAEAAVLCLPVHLVVTGSGAAAIPLVLFLPAFLAAVTLAVALACRFRDSPRTGTAIATAATIVGLAIGRSGIQSLVFTVSVCLLVAWRAITLGFRDWREPIGPSFAIGAVVLAVEAVIPTTAPHDWGPPLILLMPVFFVASLVSRAVSVWITGDESEITLERGNQWVRRAAVSTVWIPVTMIVATLLAMRGGALDRLGSYLAPVGNALVSILVFVFSQLSRPIFWLVDRLGIDPEGVRRLFDRIQRSVDGARDRAVRQAGHPSLVGRLLGLALFVLAVWALIRFIRRIRPERRGAPHPVNPAGVAEASLPIPQPEELPSRTVARRVPPADRVRRWYAEILQALARRGVEKEPAMTPAEFASEVAEAYPESARDFLALTSAYEDVRYGSAHLDRTSLRELDEHRKRIVSALRRRAPEPRPGVG
jgi:hypothetical protein